MSHDQPPYPTEHPKIRFEIHLQPEAEGWTRAAYDNIYQGEGIRQIDSFYLWLLELIAPPPGAALLDVASGESVLAGMARRRYGARAASSDLSWQAMHIARREGAGDAVVANGERLPFASHSFDYVTCIGSLEHFLDMAAGIQEMRRVLKPEGVACILVPNSYSIIGNVYSALKTGMSTIDQQPLQRYAARAEWALLLEANGLAIEQTVKYERVWPRTLKDALWYSHRPRALVRLGLTPLIPLNWASCFVYLCRPATATATLPAYLR